MTSAAASHLTGDELDAAIDGTPGSRAASHLETCSDCRLLVAADRDLVRRLAQLPQLEPAPGFERRVLAQVAIGGSRAVAAPTERSLAARRRMWWGGLAVGGSVAAALGWAALNPAAAAGVASPVVGQAGHALWHALQGATNAAHDLGWLAGIRGAIATPLRVLGFAAVGGAIYAAALGGLGRLLAEPAPDARW